MDDARWILRRSARSVVVAWLMVYCLARSRVAAADISYSKLDLSTVRVFALAGVGTMDVKHTATGRAFVLALPLAGHGSGLVITDDGLILTARHVVEGAREIVVRAPGSKETLPARVVYVDDRQDFAFLSVAGQLGAHVDLPATAPALRVRQTVFAVGYPLDASKSRPQSTRGVVSGNEDPGTYALGISVNPGNSGGPLVDESENVLGVVVARGDPSKGVQGIGYAVPLDRVLSVLGVAKERHARARATLEAVPESEREFARVVSGLVEGAGVWKMLDDSERALKHLRQSALSASMTKLLGQTKVDPDLLVLACAYHWNDAVVRRALAEGDWEKSLRTSESYCSRAARADQDVPHRSPFVKLVVSRDPMFQPSQRSNVAVVGKTPEADPPKTAAGFTLGSSPDEAAKVCTAAKLKLTGLKKDGLRCSGAPVSVGFPAVVRLRFCSDRLCAIELIQKLEGDDASNWIAAYEGQQGRLSSAFGPPNRREHTISTDCTESLAWCLSNQKVRFDDGWVWKVEGTEVSLELDRVDARGILRTTYRH